MRVALPLTLAVLRLSAACGAPRALEDVAYDTEHSAQKLDVYLPEGDEANRPAVMLIHGGAWLFGDKRAYANLGEFDGAGRLAANTRFVLLSIGLTVGWVF